LLSFCIERDFHFISAVKSDRKFNSADHNLQVKQWARILPKRALDLVTVNTTSYKVWSATGRLSSEHHITPGDTQRQHQSLSRSAEIAQVFVLAQHGFDLDSVYLRLPA